MKHRKSVILILLAILIAAFFYGKYLMFKLDWALISSATSPNGAYTIKHYSSQSEAGHAPYGDNLVIESWKSFPTPKSGETFFAGHCGKDFYFKWESNEKIIIQCPNVTPQDLIRTQAVIVHGIKVEVINK